jgi:succinate dehydrogenase / fumarate reductase flavoprotein subunit
MEFWQFHPTGVAGAGVLITEGVRGEGGYPAQQGRRALHGALRAERQGSRQRDVVSRAMATEIKEGRGCGKDGTTCCSSSTTSAPSHHEALPGIREIAIKFANVDPVKDPIPVVPTCHYQMGGIPTNYHGQVVVPKGGNMESVGPRGSTRRRMRLRVGARRQPPRHQFAARPARVRQVGRRPHVQFLKENGRPQGSAQGRRRPYSLARGSRGSKARPGGESVHEVAPTCAHHAGACGVFRFPDMLAEGVKKIRRSPNARRAPRSRTRAGVQHGPHRGAGTRQPDRSRPATMVSAEARKESRGAHDRADYPNRDDELAEAHALVQGFGTGSSTSRST